MIENYLMKYYEKVYKRNGKTLFWSIKLHAWLTFNREASLQLASNGKHFFNFLTTKHI